VSEETLKLPSDAHKIKTGKELRDRPGSWRREVAVKKVDGWDKTDRIVLGTVEEFDDRPIGEAWG
jgi:hypothetical protein